MSDASKRDKDKTRLVEIHLDENSIGSNTPEIHHEREVAIYDLLEDNYFELANGKTGPYRLVLSIQDAKLVMQVEQPDQSSLMSYALSLTPFRKIVKDYFLVCESYFEAIKTASPAKIEAIDMGRRGLHDDGSRLLIERLNNKISLDFDTARRLFTLICALHWRG